MRKSCCIIIVFVLSCLPSFCQTESCLAVINELENNKGIWDDKTGIGYILSHKDSFDMNNEVDAWFYSIALGTRYYSLREYAMALPYLRNVTAVLDKYGDEMEFSTNFQFVFCYYWEAVCEFYSHASKEAVLRKMQKAKTLYEKYDLAGTDVYILIQSDIEALLSGKFDNFVLIQKSTEYVMASNYVAAIPLLEQIIREWPASQPFNELAPYFNMLGYSYLSVGKLNDAESIYLKALTKLDEENEQDLEVYRNICDALGVLYCQVQNYQKARDFSYLSKNLHEKYMDFSFSYFRCLANCALAEYGLNHIYAAKLLIDVALKYMRNNVGLETAEKVGKSVSSISSITGMAFADDFDKQTKLSFQSRPYASLLSNASLIYQQAGFWDNAVLCIKESIALSEKIGEPNGLAYNNLAILYLAQSRVEEALPYFEKASALCKTDYEKNEIWFNYALALWLAHSKQCINIATKVSESLTKSITYNFAFLSQEERTNFYKHFEYYLPFVNLILYESDDTNQYGKIYNNILTTKGLLLRTSNNIKNAIMESGDSIIINNYNRMMFLRQHTMNERDSIKRVALSKEVEQLDKILSRSAASYGIFTKDNAIKWEDIRNKLKINEIAIEFYNIPIIQQNDTLQKIDGEPRYCAVLLKRDYLTPCIIPLCKESELLEYDQYDLYNTDVLYRLIWQPLENELENVKNIYFSADRELHQIGIEYALMPDSNRIDNKYRLYRLSSTRVLAEEHKPCSSDLGVLFGGLRYDINPDQLIAESRGGDYHPTKASRAVNMENVRYGVEYLPGTKAEVEAIANDFKSVKNKKCKIITGIAGTEETFHAQANNHVDIIHLATHGFFWSEDDVERRNYVSFLKDVNFDHKDFEDAALLRSGLFFSGANIGLAGKQLPDDVEDGILTAKELSAMNLGYVDMVVLSACQSGLGETSGEGVFGLQRGFKLAGANTLLMSLWKVDDNATCLLMTEFYRNYLGGESKHDALHHAQLKLRSNPEYADPEYWAAFILLDGLN